jgi:hypothetical protein
MTAWARAARTAVSSRLARSAELPGAVRCTTTEGIVIPAQAGRRPGYIRPMGTGLRRCDNTWERGIFMGDHLRALAQNVEVTDSEVRVVGSESNLLQTLGDGRLAYSPSTRVVSSNRSFDGELPRDDLLFESVVDHQRERPTIYRDAVRRHVQRAAPGRPVQ